MQTPGLVLRVRVHDLFPLFAFLRRRGSRFPLDHRGACTTFRGLIDARILDGLPWANRRRFAAAASLSSHYSLLTMSGGRLDRESNREYLGALPIRFCPATASNVMRDTEIGPGLPPRPFSWRSTNLNAPIRADSSSGSSLLVLPPNNCSSCLGGLPVVCSPISARGRGIRPR